MKMFLLFTVAFTQLAVASHGQEVSINVNNAPVTLVLYQLSQQSGYDFIYDAKLIRDLPAVTLHIDDSSLKSALTQCFKGQPLVFTFNDDKTVVIKQRAIGSVTPEIAQENVMGVVKDSLGIPLEGVSVFIKGTSRGTATDAEGRFRIQASQGDVLVFRAIGYLLREIPVGAQPMIDAVLISQSSNLEEVVVVGYGTQKRSDITGAITSYNADDIESRPVARVDQALVGQMAGVQVKQTSGVAGKAFSIQVRGAGSISAGNEPLYVIDGFPLTQASPNASGSFSTGNPLDNINPNDIASIQVLKDAASAAIYGSRAANGVVLITTKQGSSGKPQLNFSSYVGYNEPNRQLDILSSEEWIDRAIEMHDAAWIASGPGRTADQTSDERRAILNLGPGEVNTLLMVDDRWLQPGYPGLNLIDWQDEIFRKGVTQNYQLSGSGGSDFVRYYVSGNYIDQNGIITGMDYTSYAARANVEVNASEKLKFGLNLTPSYSIANDPGAEGNNNVIQTGMLFTPVQESAVGIYPNVFNNGQYKWGTSANSPVARLEHRIGQTKRFRTLASTFATYELMEGLAFRTSLNLDHTESDTKNYMPYTVNGALTARQSDQPGLGTSGSFNTYRKQTFVNENTLTYSRVFASMHDLTTLAGASFNSDKFEMASLSSVGGYNSSVITTLNAAAGVDGNTMETKNVLLSYFGRIQYAYNSKYLLSASLRRDGSSRFGSNTKWGWFPSASLGWRISDEHFLSEIPFLDNLMLRASWGKSGNYNIGDYSSIPLLGFSNYSFNNDQAAGQAPVGIVNPDLSWETSTTKDLGLDIALFASRIMLSFDYYDKLNANLLLYVPTLASTGFPTTLDNEGKVRNRGWEIELNTRNVVGKFTWNTSLNFSHNTNQVVALARGQTQILIPSNYDIPHSILQIGEPMYSINVVKQIGILSSGDMENGAALFGTQMEGDPKYFDANQDGIIDANDRVIVGHPNPDYIWGVTNRFTYNGFDLSTLIQGQWGGSIYSLLGRAIRRTGQDYTGNVLGVYRNRWRSAADPGDGVVGKAYSTFGRIKNTDWLYSSDYWRIRNITLGYNWNRLPKTGFMNRARVYVTLENWFGRDKYDGGFNPEAANTDLSGSSSFPEPGDYGGLPLPKSLIVGLNVTF